MSDDFEIEVIPEEGQENPESQLLEILGEEDAAAAVAWLKQEYDTAKTEMDARNQKIIKWRKNLEAVASDAPKHHPFKNSSNVVVPVSQVLTQSLYAKSKGTFDAREPLWQVDCIKHDETEIEKYKFLQKFLNMLAESPTDLDMGRVLDDLILEALTVGVTFPKVVYSVNSWRVRGADGSEETEVIYHDGPAVMVAPAEKVKYRRGVKEINRLPWIAVDTALTEVELRERASKGIYDVEAVQKILGSPRTTPDETEEQQQQAETFDSGETTGLFDVSEVWFKWDVDGNGVPIDLFFTIHMESGTILKQQYNTLGTRFITVAKYMPRSMTLGGRGVGQMTESMQDEITVNHNMRNDNMKIANMRMLAVKRQSGFGKTREVYPGAVWEFDDPRNDIQPIQLGEVYPSSLQAEGTSMNYAQRAVGLSDVSMGFADSTMKSRDSVRGSAMRLEQGDSILGSILEGLRRSVAEIGMLVWMQCIANKERVIAKEESAQRLSQEELQMLRELLEMPVTEVPMRLQFTVKVTDTDKTYEQVRMTLLSLTQIYSQFAQQTIPLAQMVYGPQGMAMQQQAPELWGYMARILAGSGKLMEDIFKFSGMYDTGNYVPNSKVLDQMLDMLRNTAQAFQGAPALPGPQGAPGPVPAEGQQTAPAGTPMGAPSPTAGMPV